MEPRHTIRPIKIGDVARHAGVSPATVSRVLNEAATVRPANRDRVLRVMAELGYRPNRIASNLRRQQVQMIGVVVSDIENPHFAQMVRAVEDAAHARGYRLLLCNTDEDPEKQRDYLEVLAAERMRGVILVPSDPEAPEISHLLDLGIPLVAFDRAVSDPRADAVVVDNVGGGRRAAEHLLTLGHRRVGLVSGPTGVGTGGERLAGYEAAMRAAGLSPVYAEGGFRIAGGRRAAEELLRLPEPLTALVVANNLMTVGVLGALRERGLTIPGDIALIALDDPFWADLVEPPLTTLAQPVRRMAEGAMEILMQRIDGDHGTPRRIVFDFELTVRRSCGAAPEGA